MSVSNFGQKLFQPPGGDPSCIYGNTPEVNAWQGHSSEGYQYLTHSTQGETVDHYNYTIDNDGYGSDTIENENHDDNDEDTDSEFDDYDEPESGRRPTNNDDDGIYDTPESCQAFNNPPVVSRKTRPSITNRTVTNNGGSHPEKPIPTQRDHSLPLNTKESSHIRETSPEAGIVETLQHILRTESYRQRKPQNSEESVEVAVEDHQLYEIPEDAKQLTTAINPEPKPTRQIAPKPGVKAPPPALKPKPKPPVAKKPAIPRVQNTSAKEDSKASPSVARKISDSLNPISNLIKEIPKEDSLSGEPVDEDLYLTACDQNQSQLYEVYEVDADPKVDHSVSNSTSVASLRNTESRSPLSLPEQMRHSVNPIERTMQSSKSSRSLPTKIKARFAQFGSKVTGSKSGLDNDRPNRPRNVSDPTGITPVPAERTKPKHQSLRANSNPTNTITRQDCLYDVADEDLDEPEELLYEVSEETGHHANRKRSGESPRVPDVPFNQTRSVLNQNIAPALPNRINKPAMPPKYQPDKEASRAEAIPGPQLPPRINDLKESEAECSDEDYIMPDGKEQGPDFQMPATQINTKTVGGISSTPLLENVRDSISNTSICSEDDESYLDLEARLPLSKRPPPLTPDAPKNAKSIVKKAPPPVPSARNKQGTTKERQLPSKRISDSDPIVGLDDLIASKLEATPPTSPTTTIEEEKPVSSFTWFHGSVSRDDSEKKLNAVSKDGCFLVRNASKGSGYSLSLWYDQSIRHLRIPHNEITKKFNLGSSDIMFDSLKALIEYFTKHAIDLKMGGKCRLILPCP